MKSRELILVLIMVGYLLAILSFLAFQNSIVFENNKDQSLQMVEVFGNGTTRSYEVENPNSNASASTTIFQAIMGAAMKMGFALPFVIAGLGFIGGPMAFLHGNLSLSPDGLRVVVFLILSFISIPINYMLTKDIPLWARIPYIYLLAAIISGTPILLSENFGR